MFNEANLLERVDVWLEHAAEPAGAARPDSEAPSPVGVANIDYDAKGQRLRIDYKNGASTTLHLRPADLPADPSATRGATRPRSPSDDPQPATSPRWPRQRRLQNLHYTYDPAGNITHIQDDAQQTIFFRNQRVEPSNDYTYDALYRLIQATGREHLGQATARRSRRLARRRFNALPHLARPPGRRQRHGHVHRALRVRRRRQLPADAAPRQRPGACRLDARATTTPKPA